MSRPYRVRSLSFGQSYQGMAEFTRRKRRSNRMLVLRESEPADAETKAAAATVKGTTAAERNTKYA
jgi:hypothetical protein